MPAGWAAFAVGVFFVRLGGLLGALAGLPLFALGSKYLILARRVKVLTQRTTVADDRPPVVYLRSFEADARGRVVEANQTRAITLEQQIALTFEEFGPVIALHNPGESLPDLGATRIAGGVDWKAKVLELLGRAQMAVVLIGSTPGLLWEMKAVISTVSPERLVLLIRGRRQRSYDVSAAELNKLLPRPLPPYPTAAFRFWPGLNVIVHFDSDWTPHVERLKAPLRAMRFDTPLCPALKVSLQPVLRRLSLDYVPPSTTVTGVVAFPMVILASVLFMWTLLYLLLEWAFRS